jgi:hypothetical protein
MSAPQPLNSGIERHGKAWRGYACYDNVTLHTAQHQTKPAADANLQACLRDATPWQEHINMVIKALHDLDDVGDGMLSPRTAIMREILRDPAKLVDWGWQQIRGEPGLRDVVIIEITNIVQAIQTAARAWCLVHIGLLNDPRAQAIRSRTAWATLSNLIVEVFEVAWMSASEMHLPSLITKTDGGFAVGVPWFGPVDWDAVNPAAAALCDDLTEDFIEALTDTWMAEPSCRASLPFPPVAIAQMAMKQWVADGSPQTLTT